MLGNWFQIFVSLHFKTIGLSARGSSPLSLLRVLKRKILPPKLALHSSRKEESYIMKAFMPIYFP